MIKRLTKILTYSLFALVLAFGAFNIDKPTELKADNSLPSGYTRVDYVQATAGASYIDTGVIVSYNNSVTFSGIMSADTGSGTPIIWGEYITQAYINNGKYTFWAKNVLLDPSVSSGLNSICTFSFKAQKSTTPNGVFNGMNVTGGSSSNSTENTTSVVHLFGRYDSSQPNHHGNLGTTARFYSFSIYDNTTGAYLCDLIPVIRNSDNAVGMYDRVSNTFKGNANTSGPAFTYGKKLSVPSGYTEVGYIEQDAVTNQTGYAWTDTGVLPQAKMMIFGDIENLQYSVSYNMAEFTGVLGASNSSALVVDSFDNSNNAIKTFRTFTEKGNAYGIASTANNSFPINTKNSFISYADTSNVSIYMNGSFAQTTSQYDNTLISNLSFYTFGHNANGTFSLWSSFRRSHTRIYNLGYMSDSGVIGYLIPSIRNSDGVLGFYNAVNDTFYTNQGTVPFTTDGTIYVVNSASDFTNALNNAVSGDYVIIANDITIAEQDFAFASGVNIIQNNHTITPPTVTGYGIHSYWYTNSSYTGATTTTISAGTHYYAKYLTEIAVSTLQELNTALTTATADNVIVLTANITYDSETFTNSSLAVINNISYLKAPARTTPWSFTSWQGNPATLAPNATVHASYTASVSDETRLDIALETATQYDIIKLTNNITLTSTASNHPYGNVTGNTFTTKTFDEFDMNGYSISSSAHSNWSLGYVFDDWYSTKWTVALGSGDPAENTTYYARFSITINDNSTFTYALNGAYDGDQITLGQNVTPNVNAFTIPSYVTFNQNGKTISAPAKPYYTANGWTQDNGTTIVTSFSAGHSYYANYTPETYTITYASQTGITYVLPDDAITSYDYGIGGTLPIPTRTGYSFSGWYTNSNLTGQVYNSISSTDHGNKTFYSSWQKLPENISIANVNVFRNVGDDTTGKQNGIEDMLILFTYKIEWETIPTTPVDQWFTFRLMGTDNTTTIATYNPYPYNDYGYGMGVGYFYFPDASEMEWGGEYQIRIDGNPFAWYSISDLTTVRNIYSSNYSEKISPDDNRRLLSVKMVNIAHLLENDWYVDSDLPYMLVAQENNVTYLTQYGQTYFENSINHLRVFAPDLFLTTIIIPDYSEEKDSENTDKASLVNRWRTQYEGTWVQDSFEAIGDLLHIPWRMATSILCMVVWIILSAISARLFGTTDAGFWSGAVVFATGVTMGIMEYTIIGAGALLIALYSLYIIFWRQG